VPPVTLPLDLRSVAAARALLRQAVRDTADAPDDVPVDDAVLMLSELITNAVRHTNGVLRVDISLSNNTLRVTVIDDAPDLPVIRPPCDDATQGRGMQIIDTLADRWGATREHPLKTVWFEIVLD
jgi:anti-sigma regulatory factor (Ser/Thr protein kinase)